MLSTPRFSPLPAPPGFSPFGPPGSLPVQSVILDTMSRGLSSIQPMWLINSGPLSPGQAQPLVNWTSPSAQRSWLQLWVCMFVCDCSSLIVQQARHLSYIIALPVCPSVGKDLLLWRTPTLGLGTTGGGGGCAYRFTTYQEWTIWITTSPPTVPGVGGSTGICPFIGQESQRMDPVHVPGANHRRRATTAT